MDVAAEEEAALLALLLAVLLAVVAALLPGLPLIFLLLPPVEVEGRDFPFPTGLGCDRPALAPGKAVDDIAIDDDFAELPPAALPPLPLLPPSCLSNFLPASPRPRQ